MQFVRGEGEKVDRRIRETNRNLADRLNCIGVKQARLLSARSRAIFSTGKKHAGFVVRPHDGNDRGLRSNRVLHFREIEIPVLHQRR